VSGLRDILSVWGKDPGMEYRFVKDSTEGGSRLMRFIRGGWDYVRPSKTSEIVVGEECVYKSKSGTGSIIRYPTGDEWMYLMEIRKEYYDEDQAAKAEQIDSVESQITKTKSSDNKLGQYGQVKINRD
jgi:hypothetical protein